MFSSFCFQQVVASQRVLEGERGSTSCQSSCDFGFGFTSSNGQDACRSVIECLCPDRAFHFVPFPIVFGPRPSLTSFGRRIPFGRLRCRRRPPSNLRRLHFPADGTLKPRLLASCRDRCYSPLLSTRPHLFVLSIPLSGLFAKADGTGHILSTVEAGIEMLHLLGSLASGTMLPDVARDLFVVFARAVLMSQRSPSGAAPRSSPRRVYRVSALCRRLPHAAS